MTSRLTVLITNMWLVNRAGSTRRREQIGGAVFILTGILFAAAQRA